MGLPRAPGLAGVSPAEPPLDVHPRSTAGSPVGGAAQCFVALPRSVVELMIRGREEQGHGNVGTLVPRLPWLAGQATVRRGDSEFGV